MEWTLVDDIVSKLYSYHVVLPEIYENLNSLDVDWNFNVLSAGLVMTSQHHPLLVCSKCANLMI